MDIDDADVLHYWLLSFERHAMVAHLTFNLNEQDTNLMTEIKE